MLCSRQHQVRDRAELAGEAGQTGPGPQSHGGGGSGVGDAAGSG